MPIRVVGAACRLPGAADEAAFWQVLEEGRCTVTARPKGRWNAERFLHPRRSEPGFSYSFAGSYLEEPYAFDPTAFGISPREARQIDPQQRLLLEVVHDALEDAGLPVARLAGREVGVYVGASSLDHANLHLVDPAAIESHFMTGNTLSVVSNRLSYIFDWKGPSFTVDTACSSSLVALSEAVTAIRVGTIDVAVVAGVNMLLSPGSFVGFSRASMLSPTGLCKPFSASADGYVRAEGAIAIVLVREGAELGADRPARATILDAGINSDGRTSGIALPSPESQQVLLEQLYGRLGLDPDRLAFVEAHGTGTAVGDPAEASAIGNALGRRRGEPLPIGSVKSNIGHLEPASGLAGLLKAMLAMERRLLPRTLHLDELSPHIDFEGLNLVAAADAVPLPEGVLHAGVSSFGFGGTNAHAILRGPEPAEAPVAPAAEPRFLVVSAHTKEALAASAALYAEAVETIEPVVLASAAAHRRDRLPHRLVLPLGEAGAMASALRGFAAGERTPGLLAGRAPSGPVQIAFAYSGNGSQWAGMGRAAYQRNALFRDTLAEIDSHFQPLSGWSLAGLIESGETIEQLAKTSAAQPLIFAIQAAATAALAGYGLVPSFTLGHSAGEVAAAWAAGSLGLGDAVRLIYERSHYQEWVRDQGTMAVVARDVATVEALLRTPGLEGVEVAAINSPSSVTVSGPVEAIKALQAHARKQRIAMRALDIRYPFHSSLMGVLQEPLGQALTGLAPRDGAVTLVSTVTGEPVAGHTMDAAYWWHNMRDPVLFRGAVETAARLGAGLFVEVGARPIVAANILDTLKAANLPGEVVASLGEKDDADPIDPILATVGRAVAAGASVDDAALFGSAVRGRVALPGYPWQRRDYTPQVTREAIEFFRDVPRHPLIGNRLTGSSTEWHCLIDTTLVPYLADHRVEGQAILPGSGLAEMMLGVARELWPEGPLSLEDFDILQAMVLEDEAMREVSVRYSEAVQVVEVWSRPRLSEDEWVLHARGRIGRAAAAPHAPLVDETPLTMRADTATIYAAAEACGLGYGPSFRRVASMRRDRKTIVAEMSADPAPTLPGYRPEVMHPAVLDAAFHSLFDLVEQKPGQTRTYLPIRFGALRVHRDGAVPSRVVLTLNRDTGERIDVDVTLMDQDGTVLAAIEGALFRSVTLAYHDRGSVEFHVSPVLVSPGSLDAASAAEGALASWSQTPERDELWLLAGAVTLSAAHRALLSVLGPDPFEFGSLFDAGRLAPAAVPLATTLLEALAGSGLAHEEHADGTERWHLVPESHLPAPEAILAELVATHPEAGTEAVLLAQAVASLEQHLRKGEPIAVRPALLEAFLSGSRLLGPLQDGLRGVVDALLAQAGGEPLRVAVVEPGALGVLRALAPQAASGAVRLTLVGADRRRLAVALARSGLTAGIEMMELGAEPDRPFDLALASTAEPLLGGDATLLRRLAGHLPAGAALMVAQPPQDAVFDLMLGMAGDWYQGSVDPHFPLGRIPTVEGTRRQLGAAFGRVAAHGSPARLGTLFVAGEARPAHTDARPDAGEAMGRAGTIVLAAGPVVLTAAETAGRFDRAALAERLRADGRAVLDGPAEATVEGWRQRLDGTEGSDAVSLAGLAPAVGTDRGDRARLSHAMLEIAAILAAAQTATRTRIWVPVSGLLGADPVAEALQGFVRVAANEAPGVELRLVDLDPGLSGAAVADRLADLIEAPATESILAERELMLSTDGLRAPRAARGPAPGLRGTPAPAARLTFPRQGAVDSYLWVAEGLREPDPGEVEVRVAATGLNFRDVMLAMGLLSDDVLDAGLAGAVFGFECAGTVVRTGAGVATLKVGDRVMGFAAGAFATHVTAPAGLFSPVPEGVSLEAAASVPVAFLTAWYGLVDLAAIRPGEWVLVHGAAGGVGLAAIQIALLKGARVAATVGTADKRALVALLGAERVYDSRSLAFADQITRELGGVDVVLNSLSGEAMQASLGCLKPFGRFVELGKRDYVSNTMVGLRPFRRNLMYFGVDVDQLLAHRPDRAGALMAELTQAFAAGRLSPLLHRVFEADEIAAAFRLMQGAGHVGKIVVRPPAPGTVAQAPAAGFAPGPGTHLVLGGTRGFGFETALWLIERGAGTVVAASRSGTLDEAVADRAAPHLASGRLVVEAADAADAASVSELVRRANARPGGLHGVIHTAMVLQDGLIAGLDPAGVDTVLAPKVDGAANLDRAVEGLGLDYFVLYSSATTLIGNPGQGAYVAANGYLQGLARRRRADGLPGLAIAWGAIADAGVLARDAETAHRLERATGVIGMTAAAALGHLGRLIAAGEAAEPVAYCADIRPGPLLAELPLLSTPAFAGLFGGETEAESAGGLDLAALVAGKDDVQARTLIATLVAEEVARILRLPVEEIDLHRAFSEIGMDSLMALELKMSVEKRLGIELPVVAITALKNLDGLAGHVLGKLRGTAADGSEVAPRGGLDEVLVAQQLSDEVEMSDLAGIVAAVEERRHKTRELL